MEGRRLYRLAMELRIESERIIARCRAECITVQNHMHVVSPELEARIREWFRADEGRDPDVMSDLR